MNVKYCSDVGLLTEQELQDPILPDPLPDPPLKLFIPKRLFSSKLPSFKELKAPVEISVDTYSSAHCDPTMISSVLASLKDISLLPVPVIPD